MEIDCFNPKKGVRFMYIKATKPHWYRPYEIGTNFLEYSSQGTTEIIYDSDLLSTYPLDSTLFYYDEERDTACHNQSEKAIIVTYRDLLDSLGVRIAKNAKRVPVKTLVKILKTPKEVFFGKNKNLGLVSVVPLDWSLEK
jgi:hypothetical protein